MVAAVGPAASTPRGPAIDVSNFSGGRCRTCRQHPQGPAIDVSNFGGGRCRTCRQQPSEGLPSTSPTPVVAAVGSSDSTPRWPVIDVSLNLVPAARIFLATPTRGATSVNITTTSKQLGGKMEVRVLAKKNSGPYGAKDPGVIIPLQKSSPNQQTALRHYQLLE
jgi:hypothetical protein